MPHAHKRNTISKTLKIMERFKARDKKEKMSSADILAALQVESI